jgi:hypothetical protein
MSFKPILNLFLFVISLLQVSLCSAQDVRKVSSLTGFTGQAPKFATVKNGVLTPAAGFQLYAVEGEAILLINSKSATAASIASLVASDLKIQMSIFGESYETYKKKKKEKKPKPPKAPADPGKIPVYTFYCESLPNCNGSCSALFEDGKFKECFGNCCSSNEIVVVGAVTIGTADNPMPLD